MHLFVQVLLNSLPMAALYAILGLGYVIIFKGSGVLNFAQGQFAVLGAYLFYTFESDAHLPGGVVLLLMLVVGFALGWLCYLVVIRPLLGLGALMPVMATIALSILIEAVVLLVWGSNPQQVSVPGTSTSLVGFLRPFAFTYLQLVTVIIAIVMAGAYSLLVRYTPVGVAMRATAENVSLAAGRGISVSKVTASAWGLSVLAAALAGLLFAGQGQLDSSVANLGFAAFPAILLGGLDSIAGVLVGGFVIAFAQSAMSTYVGSEYFDVTGYFVLLIALAIRPQGIFGAKDVVRV